MMAPDPKRFDWRRCVAYFIFGAVLFFGLFWITIGVRLGFLMGAPIAGAAVCAGVALLGK